MRLIAFALCVVLAAAAAAYDAASQSRGSETLPLAKGLELVASRYVGKVIDADIKGSRKDELDDERSGVTYEVRLLTDKGQILRIRIDAYTGVFLEVDGHGFIEALRP